jgi:hypothetical protein
MRFRLTFIAYVFALSAASMAVFGAWGIAAAMAVLLYWAAVFNHPQPLTCLEWSVVFGLIAVLIGLLLPSVQSARETSRSSWCVNNLYQIGHALEYYRDVKGAFPPAASGGIVRVDRSSMSIADMVAYCRSHDAK